MRGLGLYHGLWRVRARERTAVFETYEWIHDLESELGSISHESVTPWTGGMDKPIEARAGKCDLLIR